MSHHSPLSPAAFADAGDCVVVGEPSAPDSPLSLPPLAGEAPWMHALRQELCMRTWAAVDALLASELAANDAQLSTLVQWLRGHADHAGALLGERLPAALMQSHMGANVDRAVYFPLLGRKLRDERPLSVVAPVVPGECPTVHDVMLQVGRQLWAAFHEHSREVPPAPRSIFTVDTLVRVAEQWRDDLGAASAPLVLVLLEDCGGFDRAVLRALFQLLAEAQHRQCAGRLSFCVVLWASSETLLPAEVADHLYVARFPFIPPATMLRNVLLAALVEPMLMPFEVTASVYRWLVQHMETHSQSLAWLGSLLRACVLLHFHNPLPDVQAATCRHLWILRACEADCVPPAPVHQVQAALNALPLAGLDVAAVTRQLQARREHRHRRYVGFLIVWRLLRVALDDKMKPVLAAYGDYLHHAQMEPSNTALYAEHVIGLLDRAFGTADAPVIDAAYARVSLELEVVEREHSLQSLAPLLAAARARLAQLAQPPEAPASSAAAASAASSAAPSAKDLLLAPSTLSARGLRAGGASRATVRQTVRLVAPERSLHLTALEAVFKMLVAALLPDVAPDSQTAPLLLALTRFAPEGAGLDQLTAALVGDYEHAVVGELTHASSLACRCCKDLSVEGSKRRRTLADAAGRWSHVYNNGPVSDLATREDLHVAFLYCSRNKVNNRQLDVAEWFAFFSDVFSGHDDVAQRFQLALQELQLLGLIESVAASRGNQVRKTLW